MKNSLISSLLLTGLVLAGCGRSPHSQFYVLNPIAPQQKPIGNYQHLKIGINEIQGPAYLAKPEFIVHLSAQQVKMDEYHRWVEHLDKNIKRVIEADLSTLLPGAALVVAPWDFKFVPNYQLQINILQFEVDENGNSVLRANYLIYEKDKLAKKASLYYQQHVSSVSVESLVASMNVNLNHFSKDIARAFSSL